MKALLSRIFNISPAGRAMDICCDVAAANGAVG